MLDLEPILERPWQRQRLRVSQTNESLFAQPPLEECVEAVRRNAATLSECNVNLQGRPLSAMREWSRDTLLKVAARYTSEITKTPIDPPDSEQRDHPVIVGGHQPALFHAGVWAKNFTIHRLARDTGGTSVNLVVDNDAAAMSSIRVPQGDRRHPRIAPIPFDEECVVGPWEEMTIRNRELFESFGDRVTEAMSAWSIRPLLAEIWPDVVEQSRKSESLKDALTAGRCRLERRWGLTNLELPISRLCEVDPFLWFASHLFAHAERFREVHNTVLDEFRQVNHIRSHTHPVPELIEQDGWTELPFWVWKQGETHRGHLMVRTVDKEVHLAADGETFARLPLSQTMDACCAVEVLRELPARGIRLRTRALTTTLFSRLCLGDLFVHGIGGSKYDEMTDRIISRFFRIPPPEFLTLSATLHLPLGESFTIPPQAFTQQTARRRDLLFKPEDFLAAGEHTALIAEKQQLIEEQHAARMRTGTRSQRRQRAPENLARFQRFCAINDQLAPATTAAQSQWEREIAALREESAANTVLLNREYSFGLFPESHIRPFMNFIGIA